MTTDKNKALGMNVSTASAQLKKALMFKFMQVLELDRCFQCGEVIDRVDHLSVEHKIPWLSSSDPKATFFDLENVAFSHLSCNSGAARSEKASRTHCPKGHEYTEENTRLRQPYERGKRECKTCYNAYHREWKRQHRSTSG